jgi:hypothetical protein
MGIVAGMAAMAGCGSDATETSDAASEITYHFHDASVPPEYHRSYVVTASDGEVNIVVDSYGDVLHDEDAPLDAATFRTVVDEVDALDVGEPADDDGCTGGTSSELTVSDADGSVLEAVSTVSCGGEGGDDMDRLAAAIAPLLAGFDMDRLLAADD